MDGLLIVDKPAGVTSFDVVRRVRRMFSEKRVGHCGTLDPFATGVLLVLLGRATAFSRHLMAGEKEYAATLKLGVTTDSADVTGVILQERTPPAIDEKIMTEIFQSFLGDIIQLPPLVSAVKVAGRKLYQYAREGQVDVVRPPRIVTISEINLRRIAGAEVEFDVRCSKGTYIRTLASDVGEKLGCGATLTRLRRTRVGEFTLQDCTPLADLEKTPSAQLPPTLKDYSWLEKKALAY